MKPRKEISKSIRMTNEVYNFVNAFEGEGFNEKFENLVLFCLKEESDLKQRIKSLKQTEKDVLKRVEEKRIVVNSLDRIGSYVENLIGYCANSECNSILSLSSAPAGQKRGAK